MKMEIVVKNDEKGKIHSWEAAVDSHSSSQDGFWGVDIIGYGETEAEARENLKAQICECSSKLASLAQW